MLVTLKISVPPLFFVQMNNVTPEYCLDIIQKFEVSEENKKQNVLGIEGKSCDFRVSFGVLQWCGSALVMFCWGFCCLSVTQNPLDQQLGAWGCFVSQGGDVSRCGEAAALQPSITALLSSGDGCLRLWGFIAHCVCKTNSTMQFIYSLLPARCWKPSVHSALALGIWDPAQSIHSCFHEVQNRELHFHWVLITIPIVCESNCKLYVYSESSLASTQPQSWGEID